jgi:hypothetical protein
MSGKQGQKSRLSTEVAARYHEDFMEAMDGRGRIVKTLRQRLGALVADLGGLAELSYQERSLCRRIVFLERHVEKKELSLAHGGTVAEADYLSAINCLSGLFGKIGISRRARPVQSVEDYMRARTSTPDEGAS